MFIIEASLISYKVMYKVDRVYRSEWMQEREKSMQPNLSITSLEGSWYYDPIFLLAWIGITMGQGAMGVVILISLRRWLYQGAGSLNRWSQVIWSSFLIAGLSYFLFSMLPFPFWVSLCFETMLFTVWTIRAASWAAQES